MGERMQRKVVYLPTQMLKNLSLIVKTDGRDESELIRVALGTFIDAKIVQATVIKNVELQTKPSPGNGAANSPSPPVHRSRL